MFEGRGAKRSVSLLAIWEDADESKNIRCHTKPLKEGEGGGGGGTSKSFLSFVLFCFGFTNQPKWIDYF